MERAVMLTYVQHPVEWFTHCAFHAMATTAARIVNSATTLDTITIYEIPISFGFFRDR